MTVAGWKTQQEPPLVVHVYVGSESGLTTLQWESGIFQRLKAQDMGQKSGARVLSPRERASGIKRT